ncbi:MAG: Rieske 2Fe-2S domain-containing protein [Cellvibrionaceae bacterium]|nr:Rieske 2Fe-2S domain-containing protein [Cellvibrionaceae bacterium]
MQTVFNNTWIWVGHGSEVPAKGSFKTAMFGRQPVIVTRDRKNVIHVLLNRCKHRGATVC